MPFLPGLSPVQGKAVVARFDGGRLSSVRWLAGSARNRAPARLGGPTGELPGGPERAGEGRAPLGGDPISRPTALLAMRPRPTSFVCSCTPALIGSYGRCAALVDAPRHAQTLPRCGGSCSSTPCGCASIKFAARVVELKTHVKIHLPSSAPDQAIFAMLLDRLPRLVT